MSESNQTGRHIVAGGSWIEEKRSYQPRTALFRVLSILWIFPSLGALVVLGMGWRAWFEADSVLEGLRAVKFEDWIALLLLLAHPLFAVLAWRLPRTEPMKEETVLIRNPDQGSHKLY